MKTQYSKFKITKTCTVIDFHSTLNFFYEDKIERSNNERSS